MSANNICKKIPVRSKRYLLYAAMLGLVFGGYIGALAIIHSFFKYDPEIFMIINSLAIVFAAVGFAPLEKALQQWTDNVFYKKRAGYHETLKALLTKMIACLDLKQLTKLIVDTIYNEVKVDSLAMYIKDENKNCFVLKNQRYRKGLSCQTIGLENELVSYFQNNNNVIIREKINRRHSIKQILIAKKIAVIVPFYEEKNLAGFLLLGEKLSGEPYLKEDINLLDSIGRQALIGLQNARLYEATQDKLKEQISLLEVGRLISSTLDFKKVINDIIKIVVDIAAVDRGILFLYDDKKKQLCSVVGYGASAKKDMEGIVLKVGDSVLGRIFKEGKPVYVPQVTRNTDYVRRLGAKAYLALPMKAKDKVIGLLAIDNVKSKKPLTNLNKEFLATLAGQLAVAIDNARLYDDAKRKVKELSSLNRDILKLQAHNENMLKTLPSGVLSFDNAGKIKSFNPMAELITGLKLLEVSNKNYRELWNNFPRLLAAFSTECSNKEILFKDHKGKKKPLNISTKKLIDKSGRKIGMLSVVTDMTNIKELETQVRRSDRVSVLGTMVAGIAHEIKNPLTSMKLFVQLMEENQQNPNFWREYGAIISGEVLRLEEIVENFLGFARVKDSNMEIKNIKILIEHVYRLVKTQSTQENVEVLLDLAEGLYVNADEQKMMQVFLNLILNAVQSMPAGIKNKGRVVVAADIDSEENQVVINIIDNGIGISEENLEKLWTPFFTTKQKGNGLGLSIVHKIIEEHAGAIAVESKIGRGTVFTIKLPLVAKKIKALA